MATRSYIAVMTENGIKATYCHWDGYPEYNGKILNEHYSREDALKLLEYGHISSLKDTTGACEFYHRDRGEELFPAAMLNNIGELVEVANDHGAEFIYLFDNEWLVCDTNTRKPKFISLARLLS